MSTRDNIRHIVSTAEPPTGNLGDEWFNPSSNRFFKRIATSGTTVTWVEQPFGTGSGTITGTVGFASATTSTTFSITNTVASTGTTTGALVVSGGVGIGGKLFVGQGVDLSVTDRIQTVSISSGQLTLDLSSARLFSVVMTAAITSINITNATAAGASNFVLILSYSTVAYSVVWPASFRWANGLAPALTNINGKTDIFTIFSIDGGTTFYASITGQNY